LTRRTLGKTDLEALSSHRTSLSHFLGDEQSESAPFLLVYSTSIFLSLSASLSLSLSYLNPTRVFLPRPQFRNEFESRRARRRLEPLAAIMPRFSRVFLELKFKGGTKLKSKAKIRFRLQVTLYYSRNYPAVCPLSVSFDPFYVLSLSLSLSLSHSLSFTPRHVLCSFISPSFTLMSRQSLSYVTRIQIGTRDARTHGWM